MKKFGKMVFENVWEPCQRFCTMH